MARKKHSAEQIVAILQLLKDGEKKATDSPRTT
jgi:hypothetical protein